MNRRDIAIGGLWALGTFGLVLGVMLPRGLEADNGAATRPMIKVPTLSAGGCDIVAHIVNAGGKNDRGQYAIAAGMPLTIEVTVTNTTADDVDIPVELKVGYNTVTSLMSRVPSMPVIVEQEKETFSLEPYESKTVQVATSDKSKAIPSGAAGWLMGTVAMEKAASPTVMFQTLIATGPAATQPAPGALK